MQIEFADENLEQLYGDAGFRLARIGPELTKAYRKVMGILTSASDERDLYAMKSLHYEKLAGPLRDKRSVRLNDQWRLVLRIRRDPGQTVVVVEEIADYH